MKLELNKEIYVGYVDTSGTREQDKSQKGTIYLHVVNEQLRQLSGLFVKFKITMEPIEVYSTVVTKGGEVIKHERIRTHPSLQS